MKAHALAALLMLALVLPMLAACNTSEPGVKNTMGTLSMNVQAQPAKVTDAAVDVLKDLDLLKVESTATHVDGVATGYTASDTKITVKVSRIDDENSKVSVYAGAPWDTDLSLTVMNRIKAELTPPAEK